MRKRSLLKALVFLLCLVPVLWLGWRFWNQDLTANPLEFLQHQTGDWTLRMLVATLAITPLRKLLRIPELIRYRRMLGLFAFFYGGLHFVTYLWFDKLFLLDEILKDIGKRPFITVGFLSLLLMAPLAATSTAGWIRRLGGKRWQRLHRAVYVSALAGAVHYLWLVKSDVRKPMLYLGLILLLLAYRLGAWLIPRMRSKSRPAERRSPAAGALG
jgi:methionine sulfoxide reductase heme-binding subunit